MLNPSTAVRVIRCIGSTFRGRRFLVVTAGNEFVTQREYPSFVRLSARINERQVSMEAEGSRSRRESD